MDSARPSEPHGVGSSPFLLGTASQYGEDQGDTDDDGWQRAERRRFRTPPRFLGRGQFGGQRPPLPQRKGGRFPVRPAISGSGQRVEGSSTQGLMVSPSSTDRGKAIQRMSGVVVAPRTVASKRSSSPGSGMEASTVAGEDLSHALVLFGGPDGSVREARKRQKGDEIGCIGGGAPPQLE